MAAERCTTSSCTHVIFIRNIVKKYIVNSFLYGVSKFYFNCNFLNLSKDMHPFMRRSNCSAPISPPLGSPGVRGKIEVIKKGGALEKIVIIVFI